MTCQMRARFDGRVLVPEGPINIPVGSIVEIQIETIPTEPASKFLKELARAASRMPQDPETPSDAAAQHDHYLYGTAKKP